MERVKLKSVGSKNILSGFIWSFGERIIAQLVSLVVGVVLARVLSPQDYGVISIVMIFIGISNIFVTSGFGTAIVRQKEASEVDFNTAFFISFIISVVLYFLIYLSAPYVADIYQMEVLTPVMRVFGLRILISAINNIQHAYIQRERLYKKFFIATLFGTLISCVVGITMAYTGFGVWALVAQYMTNTIIDTIVLLFVGGWYPKLQFSILCAKKIYAFGWKMLCSQLICTLSNDIRGLIIGKVFGANELAYYDQGKKYPAVIVDNINVAITKVMLPEFARKQEDLVEFKKILRKSIKIGIFIIAPIMCGFAAVAENFVYVVLTEKWIAVVPFIQIMCIAYMFRPLEEFCHRAILALGKSGTSMFIMATVNTISISLTLVATFVLKNVMWVVIFYLFHTLCSLMCFMYFSNKYIGYKFKEQLKDIIPSIIISIFMCIVIRVLYLLDINNIALLIIQVISGGLVYLSTAKILKFDQLNQILHVFKYVSKSKKN